MIRNRLYIALAAWLLSGVSLVLSVLVLVGVLGGVLGSWTAETFFGLLVGIFFVATWGLQFELARAWVQDRKVHPVVALAGPLLALVAIGIFWNVLPFCFPLVIFGVYLAWFHWPWALKNKSKLSH